MNFSCSPLTKAIRYGNVENLEKLLNSRKYRVDISDNLGYTCLHMIAQDSNANIDALNILLDQEDVEVNAQTEEGFTSLYLACNKEHPQYNIINKLLSRGANPNISDLEAITPLHQACKYGNVKLIELLLQFKADINCQDYNNYTPLHYCIERHKKEAAKYLLQRGADPNICELHNLNSLMFAIFCKSSFAQIFITHTRNLNAQANDLKRALCLAIIRQNVSVIKCLLLKNVKILPSFKYLIKNKKLPSIKIFKLLFDFDPQSLFKIKNFIPVVHLETIKKRLPYLKIILQKPSVDWNLKSKTGIFSIIFNNKTKVYTCKTHFVRNKILYINFFKRLFQQGLLLSSADLERFLVYFDKCPYKVQLYKIILDYITPDITEYLLIKAAESDADLGKIFLQHCLHMIPDTLYKTICDKKRWDLMNFFGKYFTPLYLRKPNVQSIIEYELKETDLVKTLMETARDCVRQELQETVEDSDEFVKVLNNENIPDDIKDIIYCKIEVNRNFMFIKKN